jgi:hypothetical protein
MDTAKILGSIAIALALCSMGAAQKKAKDYKDLDQEALKLFKEGKYAQAHKNWSYIHNSYPRAAFRDMAANDPRFIAWQIAFFSSIIREGAAKKQQLLEEKSDAKSRARAEQVYQRGLSEAKEMMRRSGVPQATQERLIKDAMQPLLDALKKKDEPEKKK